MRGLFITFEGIDGCGKTSQLRGLAGRLRGRGLDPVETREPGGTAAGDAIRDLLLREVAPPLVPEAELHLFAAARAQHVHELLRPALEAGRVVLCDRYADATVAYQGHGRGMDLALIRELNRLATGGLSPDVTLVLDIPVETAVARITGRSGDGEQPSRFDLESLAFHRRVRQGYHALAEAEPGRVRLVDADADVAAVADRVDRAVSPAIERWLSRS